MGYDLLQEQNFWTCAVNVPKSPMVVDTNQSPDANWINELGAPQLVQVFGL
jgi:hypothetical protein